MSIAALFSWAAAVFNAILVEGGGVFFGKGILAEGLAICFSGVVEGLVTAMEGVVTGVVVAAVGVTGLSVFGVAGAVKAG